MQNASNSHNKGHHNPCLLAWTGCNCNISTKNHILQFATTNLPPHLTLRIALILCTDLRKYVDIVSISTFNFQHIMKVNQQQA